MHINLAQYARTMRPTGLAAGIDKDRPDYTIYNSGLEEAKAQFETAWRQWLAWAKLQEML